MILKKTLAIILGFILILFLENYAQVEGDIENFLNNYAEDIFTIYHSSSTIGSSSVEVEYVKRSGANYKATLRIEYSGWIKNHTMKIYIYFYHSEPVEVVFGSDSNMNQSNLNSKGKKTLNLLRSHWSEDN
jgi:hypothetical protein